MDKAVVLLSGGLSSAVASAGASEKYEQYMLFANFHQRAMDQELKAYDALCEHWGVKHRWKVELSHFRQVGGNALVDPKRDIEDADGLDADIAGTFVAGLLPTLLDVATSFAFRIGARHIVCGISEALGGPGPGAGVMYPDRRRQCIQNYQYMLEAALPERTQITVETPVMDFTRREIVQLGHRLKVPFDLTWSCYLGDDPACGRCYGCANRAAGFSEAGIADPRVLSGRERG